VTGPEPRSLPHTGRGTAMSCYRRKRYWSGTASWPRSMDTRPTGLWPRRAHIASAVSTNPTASRNRPLRPRSSLRAFRRAGPARPSGSGAQSRHG
jgi:hypothetical protein